MESRVKIRLSLYGIISAITYMYLLLTTSPGVSVPVFILIQFCLISFIVKDREKVNNKGILMMIPIFIISLNCFISASYGWRTSNFFMIVLLYSVMILMMNGNLKLKDLNTEGIFKIILNTFEPFTNFIIPFRWAAERSKNKEKNQLIKRIIIGITISLPCVLFLIIMLSSADMIFNKNIISLNKWFFGLLDFYYVFRLISGMFAGLYLFGHLYSVLAEKHDTIAELTFPNANSAKKANGDVIVLNILLFSILAIYTIFIVIQFKYLFSAGELPYGLNYAEYARHGFFELVFLSVLNIALILLTTYLLKDKIYIDKNKWARLTKLMMIYLCVLTGILLVSSYYRMSLYDGAYGFTRLRIFVYMFLMFEAFGLLATLIYVIRHNFNILAVYAAVALTYYLTLNLVNVDSIIARRNIDMYFSGQTKTVDMDYLMGLSADAAPQIMRLLDDGVEIIVKNKARIYLTNLDELYGSMEYNWQSYNLSMERTRKLLSANKDSLQFK
ncbi:MAG TPA: hypothetical protein DCM73_03345 [Clostridiales bacterium]|nr:hypothetical protein [Clostridiales bacterium]